MYILADDRPQKTVKALSQTFLGLQLVLQLSSGLAKNKSIKILKLTGKRPFRRELLLVADAWQSFVAALALMSQLCEFRYVSARNIANGRFYVAVTDIAAGLQTCSQLKKLNLDGNRCETERCGQSLGTALPSLSQLCELSLVRCDLTAAVFKHIAAGLQGCHKLTTLILDENKLIANDEDDGRLFGDTVGSLSQLHKLSFDDCDITDVAFRHIAHGIVQGCHQLTELSCHNKSMTDDSMDALRHLLTSLPDLVIDVDSTGLSDYVKCTLWNEFIGRINLIHRVLDEFDDSWP